MARVPSQQRLGFGERRQMIRRDQPSHRDRAQVGDQQIVAALQLFGRPGVDAEPEATGPVE